jgi:hypothetical protein
MGGTSLAESSGGGNMDRDDEKKDLDVSDDVERTGEVLGLGRAAVPKSPGDPTASNDPESVARRRERAREEEASRSINREDPYKQSPGATGIDMGSAGRGTDVSGE